MKQRRFIPIAAIAGVCVLIGAAGGIAGGSAASKGSSADSAASRSNSQPAPPPGQSGPGRHIGANGKQERPLSGDIAAKVKAAALAKVDGTVERVETDADHGSPYEAHVRKSDGTEAEVLVNSDFEVTAVNSMQRP